MNEAQRVLFVLLLFRLFSTDFTITFTQPQQPQNRRECLFHGSRFPAVTPSLRRRFVSNAWFRGRTHRCVTASARRTGVLLCVVREESHNAEMTDTPGRGEGPFVRDAGLQPSVSSYPRPQPLYLGAGWRVEGSGVALKPPGYFQVCRNTWWVQSGLHKPVNTPSTK